MDTASNDFNYLKFAAVDGQCIALLPTLESEAEVAAGPLRVVLPELEMSGGLRRTPERQAALAESVRICGLRRGLVAGL